MENANIGQHLKSDQFFDALEESPFLDCNGKDEFRESSSESLTHEIVEDGDSEVFRANDSSITTPRSGLRRRRSLRLSREGSPGFDEKGERSDSPVVSEVTLASDSLFHAQKSNKQNDHDKVREISDSPRLRSNPDPSISIQEEDNEVSTVTSANNERVDESATGDSRVANTDENSSSFLVLVAGLMIKAIEFQFSILIKLFTFPIWLSYYAFVFVIDPFQTTRRAKRYLTAKLFGIWGNIWGIISPYIFERLKGYKIGSLIAKLGCGLFWSVYVCFMLCGLLVLAFLMGGFVMRYIVEEPIQLKETLSFDYTMENPVAYVPLTHCSGALCGSDCKGLDEVKKNVGSRFAPPGHKLELTISLTLPESEYNKKLGVFQVRVVFLSANGTVVSSLRDTCMLRFKSEPIRYLETFLRTAPLVTGYSSESQTLNLRMRGFTEEKEPTACLRVVLERRAEYRSGAGLPEIYGASLVIESELPLFKRFIWYWKKTIFVWTSIYLLMVELMFVLVCCRPILLPRAKPRVGSTANSSSRPNAGTQS